MPTFTTTEAFIVDGVATTALEQRLYDTAMFMGDGSNNGVRGGIVRHGPTSLGVTVNGSDQVTIQAGACVIPAGTGLGVWRGALAAAVGPSAGTALTARNATNPRIDLVVAQATGTNITFKTIDGTPAASPVAPALPAQHIELARLTVPPVAGGAVTVSNLFREYANALGGVLYVATSARLPISGTQKSQRAIALDTGFEHVYDGVNWHAQEGEAGFSVTNGPSTNAAGTLVFPRAGAGMAVVNVNLTTTAIHGAGSVLFTITDAAHWPVVETFATLTDTTGDVPVRVGVSAATGQCVQQGAIPNGRIVRGSIPLPL